MSYTDGSLTAKDDVGRRRSFRSRRSTRIVAWIAAVGVVALLGFVWLRPSEGSRPPTIEVSRGNIERRLLLEGRVKPKQTYALNFPVPASGDNVGPNIEEVFVVAGDRVREGQILATLEGDRVESAMLRSPVDGYVVEVRGARGAPPPQGSVVTVRTLELVAAFTLSEANLAELRPGMEATLTVPVLSKSLATVLERLPSDPQSETTGIGSLQGGAVQQSQAINYELTVPLPDLEGLRPGMTVNLDVLVGRREGVLHVPQEALKYDEEGPYVEIVEGRFTKPARVKTGLSDESNVEILEGVTEGQEVITR